MRRGRRLLGMAVGAAVAASTLLIPARPAGAAGVTTHAWMALAAIPKVQDAQLKALLVANQEAVRTGAHFPDSGYAPGNQYGEEAHWRRFHDAYLAQIQERDCGDLTAPKGPCAPIVAHLMGNMAHGMGDEVWDWLFEPYAPDLDEYYLPPDFGSYASEGGLELQMDLVAIARHQQSTASIAPIPDKAILLDSFAAVDFDAVDLDAIGRGEGSMQVVKLAEAFWAPRHIDPLSADMPWLSHNMITAPGGVEFAATAIAANWEAMWGRLLGDQPPTEVSVTYPADGQRRVPATGWDREMQPGSSRDRGGARTRVAAALTYSRPYVTAADPAPVSDQLPAGAMRLVERDTSVEVPLRSGWPRTVPYGASSGGHLIGLQPAGDLAPCTWYRAEVTGALLDANDEPVVAHEWEFRTGLDGVGSPCPDDPRTPDERFAAKVAADLVDRPATDAELAAATYAFERGRTRRTHAGTVLDGAEHRELLVTEAFQRYLGRTPDPSGLAFWSKKLPGLTITEIEARLAGSAEVYRRAGGTDRAYVEALYPLVLGRAGDPAGIDYWTRRLGAGTTRVGFARSLLRSSEHSRQLVRAAYDDLLGRAPDPSGLAYWTRALGRGTSPRSLLESIILGSEYDRQAQAS